MNIEEYEMPFGKYKGKTIKFIRDENPQYLIGIYNHINRHLDSKVSDYIGDNYEELKKEAKSNPQPIVGSTRKIFTKLDLIKMVAKTLHFNHSNSRILVNNIIFQLSVYMTKYNNIEIADFGTFIVRNTGFTAMNINSLNPYKKPGDVKLIPVKYPITVQFTPNKHLEKRITKNWKDNWNKE